MSSVDAPAAPEEAALDDLDFVNLKVFGNAAFRHQQRDVIDAVMKVGSPKLLQSAADPAHVTGT